MGLYGKPVTRCTWCIKWELPCGADTHENVLARYLPLVSSTDLSPAQFADRGTVNYVSGEPAVRQPTPDPAIRADAARRRADRISLVATVVLLLCAAAVMVFGYITVIGDGFGEAPGCGSACVPTTYGPPADTGGPVLLTTGPTTAPSLPPDPGR